MLCWMFGGGGGVLSGLVEGEISCCLGGWRGAGLGEVEGGVVVMVVVVVGVAKG